MTLFRLKVERFLINSFFSSSGKSVFFLEGTPFLQYRVYSSCNFRKSALPLLRSFRAIDRSLTLILITIVPADGNLLRIKKCTSLERRRRGKESRPIILLHSKSPLLFLLRTVSGCSYEAAATAAASNNFRGWRRNRSSVFQVTVDRVIVADMNAAHGHGAI